MPLSKRQSEVLQFLRDYTEEMGKSPTTNDIARWFGVTCGSISPKLAALEVAGLVFRENRRGKRVWSRIHVVGAGK